MTDPLAAWYRASGRHDLAWRHERDPWPILVSEVMLQQTQVARVAERWPAFMARFPTPKAMAEQPLGAVIEAWGRLGYPRRARGLWNASRLIAAHGWPADLRTLPGAGVYTAPAVVIQAFDRDDLDAADVNITRVVSRWTGALLTNRAAARQWRQVPTALCGRDRFLALMDLGAIVCTKRSPCCERCPLMPSCTTCGPLAAEPVSRQPRYAGSFRERRGTVLAALRVGPQPAAGLDREALESLVADGLATVDTRAGQAALP